MTRDVVTLVLPGSKQHLLDAIVNHRKSAFPVIKARTKEFVGLWYILSSTVAAILVLWLNFVLNKKWTFGDWRAFQLLLPAK